MTLISGIPAGYHSVTDADGNISIVADPEKTNQVAKLVSISASWLSARSKETNTHLGGAVLGASYTSISDNARAALAAYFANDYTGCVTHAIPALLAIAGSLAAIIKPEPISQ